MKYYIITIHCIPNFGSVFQSYALIQYLRKNGYDAELIDYRPGYYFKGRHTIKSYLAKILNLKSYISQSCKYNSFIDKEIAHTLIRYKDIRALSALNKENAVFISGGDQIWNNFHQSGRDDAYKLTFISSGQTKLAFGTSMGRTSFSDDELQEMSKKINDYKFIGLREQTTVPLLKRYLNVPICHVCDPVLLLSKEEYYKFIGDIPLISEPYLLMYLTNKSTLLDKVIDFLAKKYHLKIVHVSGFKRKCRCDYFLKSTGPAELLNIIYYSKFVVSASFHATLFSLLFEKQFCTLLPEAGTNARIEDLLGYFDLQERIINSESSIRNLEQIVDFSSIRNRMLSFVSESQSRLKNIL